MGYPMALSVDFSRAFDYNGTMTNITGNIAADLSLDELELAAFPPEGTPSFEAIAEFDGMAEYPEIPRSQEGSFGPSLSFVVSLYSLELSVGKVAVVIVESGADDGPEDLIDMDMLRIFPIAELASATSFYETCIRDFEANWADIIR